jgi:hypothetical protein
MSNQMEKPIKVNLDLKIWMTHNLDKFRFKNIMHSKIKRWMKNFSKQYKSYIIVKIILTTI